MAASPLGPVVAPEHVAHAVVAGILGLEMLASLDGDRDAALALFDRAQRDRRAPRPAASGGGAACPRGQGRAGPRKAQAGHRQGRLRTAKASAARKDNAPRDDVPGTTRLQGEQGEQG